jgi:acetyl/propionyl-CoA carboxylase alpha subunit
VHLFERDCSVQRRHQKVIEESPTPGLSPAVRARMGAAAVALAQAAGYVNAGTIEFLLEGDGDAARFYFLEMNTRLQVEHPVTESVAGVDLVQAQIDVADGGPLPWTQDALAQRGHAIECRIYAEAPERGFLPQAGRILEWQQPSGPGVRVDAGFAAGSDVPVHYDPLLAKLIVWGATRGEAIRRALRALDEFVITGIRTNLAFLAHVLRSDEFTDGVVHTRWVDERIQTLTAVSDAPGIARPHAAGGDARPASGEPWRDLTNWRLNAIARPRTMPAATGASGQTARRAHVRDQDALSAPMPATVVRINVAAGDTVKDGDVLVLLEAMKMELPVRAPRDGVVARVNCRPSELVQPGEPLVELT